MNELEVTNTAVRAPRLGAWARRGLSPSKLEACPPSSAMVATCPGCAAGGRRKAPDMHCQCWGAVGVCQPLGGTGVSLPWRVSSLWVFTWSGEEKEEHGT